MPGSVGGNLVLSSGQGTTNGNIIINTGINTVLEITENDPIGSLSSFYTKNIAFDGYVLSPTRGQYTITTPSVTAQDLTIYAQTATNGYGGNLILSSGDGLFYEGLIEFQIGGVTNSNLGSDGYGAYLNIGSIPAHTGIFRIPNNTALKARNNTNNGDINLIGSNTSNNISIGEASLTTVIEGDLTVMGALTTASAITILTVGKINNLSNGTDGYLLSSFVESSDESFPAIVINNIAGNLKRLVVTCSQKPAAGQTVAILIRKNLVDTILTVTLTDTMTANTVGYIAQDLVNTVGVTFGDWITVRFISSATANVKNIMVSFEII